MARNSLLQQLLESLHRLAKMLKTTVPGFVAISNDS